MYDNTKYKNILISTFLHFKGIGKKTENKLWNNGVFNWDDLELFYERKQLSLFDDSYKKPIFHNINASRKALQQEDVDYFTSLLPQREFFRIVLSFFSKTIFLDIETTGLSKYYDYTTVIGWSSGGRYNYYIKGDDDSYLRKSLSEAKCIVTFNGSIFDIPFLKKEFNNLAMPKAHVDLRFFSRRVGLSGGQKKIEKQINIQRAQNIENIDGKTATILWYKYLRGDLESLRSLIKYNYYDVIGMEIIFDEIVNKLLKMNSFPAFSMPIYRFRGNKKIPQFRLKIPKATWKNKIKYLKNTIVSTSLYELTKQEENIKQTIIGIDLTGSEKRATGICLLSGDTVQTKLINSDSEIIDYTIKQKPQLVSIDSPLSLPEGRISVSDDDPGRDKYGIMRICERILKKRGVNVYPSLIPSMQKLTERGIKLANILRSSGIPVIESYPGAAQDILKIPRKRSDIKMLKEGLIEFGIKGDYLNNSVTHDELDAITSALVGYFFLYGKFEALGNLEEEYLIIPDINEKKSIWGSRTIIGFSGPMATGKTTAGRFLELKGYYYTRFSLILENMLIEKGKEPTRKNLQDIGIKIKNENQRILCKKLYKNIPSDGNVVIDGIRHPEDHAFLIELFGQNFKHIFIDSPLQSRRERYITMGKNAQEFDNAIYHKVEENVSKLSEFAHLKVTNDKSIKEFQLTINNILKTVHK